MVLASARLGSAARRPRSRAWTRAARACY